jgi:hypothetical protein
LNLLLNEVQSVDFFLGSLLLLSILIPPSLPLVKGGDELSPYISISLSPHLLNFLEISADLRVRIEESLPE